MNFAAAAQHVCEAVAIVAGTVIGVRLLWKAAKAAFKANQAWVANRREVEALIATTPRSKPFIPPEERLRP